MGILGLYKGWKWGRETEICTVVKLLLDVFAFDTEEEREAHVNKPFHPLSTSHSSSLGKERQ